MERDDRIITARLHGDVATDVARVEIFVREDVVADGASVLGDAVEEMRVDVGAEAEAEDARTVWAANDNVGSRNEDSTVSPISSSRGTAIASE